MSRVLLDGWSLAYEPASPAALQTWALLARPASEVEFNLALPCERLDWLPSDIESTQLPTENKPWSRLAWEQRELARLSDSVKADFIHTTGKSAPIFTRRICTNSPAYFSEQPGRHASVERFRKSAGQGGLSTLRGLLWPSDLPGSTPAMVSCPPFVHPEFNQLSGLDNTPPLELPEEFILYHGPQDEVSLHRLLSAWSWAAGPVGSTYPLLMLSPSLTSRDTTWTLIKEFQEAGSVQVFIEPHTPSIPMIYQRCTVLFHPAEISPWGDPVLQALAVGKPIVAATTRWSSSRLGPAAYLAPMDDPRALGAALITLVVEEDMAKNLAEAARQRASAWDHLSIRGAFRNLWKL